MHVLCFHLFSTKSLSNILFGNSLNPVDAECLGGAGLDQCAVCFDADGDLAVHGKWFNAPHH